MTATILNAATASSGSALSAGNDGTLVIQTGATAGAQVNAISLAADGTPTLIKQPVLPAQSMVRLNTSNGWGSTNIYIRRFTNVVTNQGSDITYADSATLGATFTINTAGVYAVSYTDHSNGAGAQRGLSLNSTQLTTQIGAINAADRLVNGASVSANPPTCVSWTGYLPAGSVIRAHTDNTPDGAVLAQANFTITRVA